MHRQEGLKIHLLVFPLSYQLYLSYITATG